MAYPPTPPPASRTNTTPQANNHPSDHNQLSACITDIVNELGNNPSGPQGTLQQRVSQNETNKLNRNGSQPMTGNLNMNGFDVFNLPTPNGASEAVNKDYCDDKLAKSGGTVSGAVIVGQSPDSGPGFRVNPDGTIGSTVNTSGIGTNNLNLRRGAAANGDGEVFVRFESGAAPGTLLSSIAVRTAAGGGVTMSNCTTTNPSDRRLKQNNGPITDAAPRIQALASTAFRGVFLSDPGNEGDMLYADQVQVAAPYAVTGEMDAVDSEGNPVYQEVSYPVLVPLLIAALGNALNRIDALEAGG